MSRVRSITMPVDRRRWDILVSGSLASEFTNTNAPAAFAETVPLRHRRYIDFTGITQLRITWSCSVVGAAGCIFGLEYSLDDGVNWYHMDDGSAGGAIGTHKPQASVASTGTFENAWFTLTPAARTNVLVRLVCEGGNGVADPQLPHLALEGI